jgi:tetratricopeptide (TPR) repeat protein
VDYAPEATRFDDGNRRLVELGLAFRRGTIDDAQLRDGWLAILRGGGRWVGADRDAFIASLSSVRLGSSSSIRRPLEAAFAAAKKGDIAERDRAAAEARAAMEREGASAGADAWVSLARVYTDPPAPTLAEDAARHAAEDPRGAEVLAWSALTRANVGLPPGTGAGVGVAEEPVYIGRVLAIAGQLAKGDRADARTALAAARKSWPAAPGLLALECERQLRDGRIAEGRRACERALAGWEGCRPAQVLLGQLHLATRNPGRAVPYLRRAVELDPSEGGAQRALGEALRAVGDRAGLEAHEAAYRARFGRPLPR